jgi:hypothetical protein
VLTVAKIYQIRKSYLLLIMAIDLSVNQPIIFLQNGNLYHPPCCPGGVCATSVAAFSVCQVTRHHRFVLRVSQYQAADALKQQARWSHGLASPVLAQLLIAQRRGRLDGTISQSQRPCSLDAAVSLNGTLLTTKKFARILQPRIEGKPVRDPPSCVSHGLLSRHL